VVSFRISLQLNLKCFLQVSCLKVKNPNTCIVDTFSVRLWKFIISAVTHHCYPVTVDTVESRFFIEVQSIITYETLKQDKLFQGTYPSSSTQQQPLVGQGLLIIEASRSHIDTPRSVGLLWTSDQPVAETSRRQHTADKQTSMPPREIRTRNPSKREAAGPLGSAQCTYSISQRNVPEHFIEYIS
jgi:hypothetical protein